MPHRTSLPPHTRFLLIFSAILVLGLAGFWAYYQAYGIPGVRFPFLSPLSEPTWEELAQLRADPEAPEDSGLLATNRPVQVLVWVDRDQDLAWEQWKHLASIADHHRMDLATVTVFSDEPLQDIAAHAEQMDLPTSSDYRFVSLSEEELDLIFQPSQLKSTPTTWVYLHKEPVYCSRGRVVPPREWLDLLEW